ncbi:CinA family protein [bacterium]|nr:CinA family protein [bacterium]
MVHKIVETLQSKKLTLSIAESCTGGLVCDAFVSVSGVSSVFSHGLITYSNQSKKELLGVSEKTLETDGAVSKETVSEMLAGLHSDVGIAVSGIAGPGGGTAEKPVGTVIIGIKTVDNSHIERYQFSGNRNEIRNEATKKALLMLFKAVC